MYFTENENSRWKWQLIKPTIKSKINKYLQIFIIPLKRLKKTTLMSQQTKSPAEKEVHF